MYRLTGFLWEDALSDPEAIIRGMADTHVHHGSDDTGVWIDTEAGIVLANRQLSGLDPSPAGHKPMASTSGRYVIVYNGTIYNHLDLRVELESMNAAPAWRGGSDTETLLAGCDAWGIEETVKRATGAFAFALWDRQNATLTLGRDRLGEKSLYYGWQDNTFLFASELKAIEAHPAFSRQVDRGAIALLMRHNYIPAPYSIYRGIRKLLPGSLLTISMRKRDDAPVRYWDARKVVADGLAHPFEGTPDDAVETLEALISASVRRQMAADTPPGAFLSGGVDSSLVAALMQSQSERPVRTFSIGFHEADYDEAKYAAAVAKRLGTEHTELYVTARQAMDVIPRLPELYCEPFSDSSQIPTFLVGQLARQYVTVSLSGDAGDELFGGYSRYMLGQRFWGGLSRIPARLRTLSSRGITALSPAAWNRLLKPIGVLRRHKIWNPGDRLHKGAAVMGARTSAELYRLLVSHCDTPASLVLNAQEPPTVLTSPELQPKTDNFVHQMMALDLVTYLPDDCLVKVDRAAMGAGLEVRVPFLDHTIVEFAWKLPLEYKLREGVGKWPLRQVLYRHVQRELIERPKMGFGVPTDIWLRGPLRDWAENLLSEERIRREGFLNPAPIREKWNEHLSGQRNWQYLLWDVLMFQAWLERHHNH